MKREVKGNLLCAAVSLAAFAVWTALVRVVDVAPIGPRGSAVGFSTLNAAFHALTGSNMMLYTVTDWLGLVPIAVALAFSVLGLVQWVKRKSIARVDRSILALGIFYVAVMAAYALFECVVINYRPVLIEGCLEGSYPSSTTLLVLCVIPTAMLQCKARIARKGCRRAVLLAMGAFLGFMVIGRVLSGVHWFSDIIGGMLLSAGLVAFYRALARQ
jgi:undecaprenyl-diphosphatase